MRIRFYHGYLALVFVILFLLSCDYKNSLKNEFTQFEVKQIEFEIDSTISKESNTIQYFSERGDQYLVIFNEPTNEIIWFDFKQKAIVKRTKLKTQGPNNIGKPFGIHIKSLDSIFVLSSATYSLALINNKGQVLNNYRLFSGELNFAGVPKNSKNSIKPIMQSTNPLITLSDSAVALAGLPDANPLDTEFYDSKVYIKLNLNSGEIEYKIPYPKRYQNKLWGLYHSFPYHTFNNNTGKAVISFPASEILYQTDFVNLDSISVPSNFVEEPSSWKEAKANGLEMMRFFVSSPSFYRIVYDPYESLYYRFSQFSSDIDFSDVDMAQLSVFNSKRTYLSVLDKELNLVIEMKLPKKYDPRFIFTAPEGLHIAKKNNNEDKMTFGVFDF